MILQVEKLKQTTDTGLAQSVTCRSVFLLCTIHLNSFLSTMIIWFILTIFGKCNACYRSRMTREVGYVRPLFQIPNFYHGIFCSSAKDKTVRMELSAC